MRIFAYIQNMTYEEAKTLSEILKAISHPIRILIVAELREKDKTVGELNHVANIDQSGISRHLSHLKAAGIVTDRRVGNHTYYHLQNSCIVRAFECSMEVYNNVQKCSLRFNNKRKLCD